MRRNQLYIPLCNLTKTYYEDIDNVAAFNMWKKDIASNWKDIKITQVNNLDNITIDAGNNIEVRCEVEFPNINQENIDVEVLEDEYSQEILKLLYDFQDILINVIQKSEPSILSHYLIDLA